MPTVTMLQKLKSILDQCKTYNPSVPTYYYREVPPADQYPILNIEGTKESDWKSGDTMNLEGPTLFNGYFKLVLVGEAPIGDLEDIMGIIVHWMHPLVFGETNSGAGSGTVLGDPVLYPGDYTTEQLKERAPSGKQLLKLTQAYRLLFGGSF